MKDMKVEIGTGLCKKSVYIIFSFILIIIGVSIWIYVKEHHCELDYEFINPDFVCDDAQTISKKGYAKIQGEIEELIASKKSSGEISTASIYFRDLINGPVFGVNEFEDFAPASLLKLPFALVYLTESEELETDILGRKLVYTAPADSFRQNFVSTGRLKENESYTIEELLERMIEHSDNDAYQMLYSYINSIGRKDIIFNTYLELGILAPKDSYDQVISVRRYGSIFRGLFNVSLVNRDMSEKLLSWLARSTFEMGIAAGVPQSIKIAHKFGERTLVNGVKQLHDCGIVYYPKNPYLLCVMTEGRTFEDLVQFISKISRMVYEEVDSRRL